VSAPAVRPDLLFPGDGEMARRMREHDWAATALGDPREWPPALRTACRICLTSRFPMVVWWGPELTFLYNDAYRPLLGGKHPALGQPGRQVWPDIWPVIGPMLDSVLDAGQATWHEDLQLTTNRHGYWEEAYFTYSYSPLHDDAGQVRGVFTAVTETTGRVIGERRLALLQHLGAQAGRARSVAEACDLVAGALERAGGPDIPFAALYLPDEASGELTVAAASPRGAVPPPLPGGPGGWPAAEAMRTGRPARVTDVAARFGPLPAGGWRDPPAGAMVVPLAGEAGVTGAMVLAASAGQTLDPAYESFLGLVAQQVGALLTGAVAYQAQQRRAEELAELDRAKTVFFSNVSHEFRTPLTLITGPLAELRARLAGAGPDTAADLDVIERNALRLGKLVNALLDFSRLEAGRMQARFEPADLAALTADLASVFRSAMQRAGLEFEVDCPALPEPVYVDPELWEKVVLNLLSNALKFTFTGSVRVSVRAEGGHAVVRVADTGTGIPEAEMPRLFERFHRVASARARSNEGSGIGLAMAAELVALHGGTITADSTEGAGTEFTITLPFGCAHLPAASVRPGASAPPASTLTAQAFLQEAHRWLPGAPPAEPEPAGSPDGPPPGQPRPRVLLADDNADMREYLGRLLAPGYRVTAVADGLAALEAARAGPPDLVISDVMMPGLDGLGLVAALRADPATASVPVLLLSARAGQEAAIEGLEAGADDYLVKPFPAAELMARLRASLRLSVLRGRREKALAAMGVLLSEAETVAEAVTGTVREIRELWQARQVLAVTWDRDQRAGSEPAVTAAVTAAGPPARWADLPEPVRRAIGGLRQGPLLRLARAGPPGAMNGAGAGIALEHPAGRLALWAELDRGRRFTSEDEALLTQLSGFLVQALHRIHQAGQQRETALALQRAILGPAELPPGFAARYEPATRPLEVGGDWYDIIDLPGGRTGLVVGDCVGHGLEAATVMGQVRSACRALLLRESSPARAVMALDQFADQIPGALCSTVFCGILEPETGRLTYTSAGHPPGIVALPDGRIRLLDEGHAPALAVLPGTPRRDAEYTLPGRATLLLYTDGLIERRRQPIDDGISRAGQALRAGRSAPADDLADELMTGLAPPGGFEDDAALLLYRHPAPLSLALDARTSDLAPARAALRRWLGRCGLSGQVLQDVLIAAGEACANAIEHGSQRAGARKVRLTATATPTDLYLDITGTGPWKDPAPDREGYRGNGIPLMQAVMTEVTIVSGPDGTAVRLRRALDPG
jgi:signal transduction histidine kinase/DNA-binding response OmpR family regulator